MNLERLVAIMRRLRDPEHGCEWDRAQNFATIAPYTIEEAYEVADAIERVTSVQCAVAHGKSPCAVIVSFFGAEPTGSIIQRYPSCSKTMAFSRASIVFTSASLNCVSCLSCHDRVSKDHTFVAQSRSDRK